MCKKIAVIIMACFAVFANNNVVIAMPIDEIQPTTLDIAYEAALNLQWAGKYEEANETFANGCANNHAPSCNLIALSYAHGLGVIRDRTKSFELYGKSCSLNNGVGCYSVGWSYLNGEGVKKSKENAKKFYELGCKLRDGESCLDLVFERGADGKIKNPKENLPHFIEACEFGSSRACNVAGILYRDGEGVEKSHIRAVAQFKLGCGLDDAESCILAGSLLKILPDKTYISYFEKACELESEYACVLYNVDLKTPLPEAYQVSPK